MTLKLKTSDFRILTRSRSLGNPTQLAEKIFGAGREILEREINGTRYRLFGIGVSALPDADDADPADLIDQSGARRAAAERAMDRVRGKFGHQAMVKGLRSTKTTSGLPWPRATAPPGSRRRGAVPCRADGIPAAASEQNPGSTSLR